jgi:hypothetical protein
LQSGISGLEAILFRWDVAELPWAVHFIPKTPVLDAVRFLDTVLAPQIAPACATFHVAILHKVRCPFRRPCAEIHRQQRFGSDSPAPRDEFVGSELVGFHRIRGAIQDARPIFLGSDPIQPVVP